MAGKSDMFFRNTVVLTTRSILLPAAASTAERFFSTRSVWALMSPSISLPVAGSSAICPDAKMNPPALIPCEYGPMGWGASLVATTFFSCVKLTDVIRARTNSNDRHFFMLPPCGDRVVRESTDDEQAQKLRVPC